MTLVDSIVYSGGMKPRVKIYYDDTNKIEYICDAERWTALTTPKWRIKKNIKDVTGRTTDMLSAGEGWFDNVATDMATVEALTFS